MGMYRHKMPDREVSAEMTKADYWEVQADMWHQNYKEATAETEQLRNSIQEVKELLINLSNYTNPRTLAYGIGRAVVRLENALEKE